MAHLEFEIPLIELEQSIAALAQEPDSPDNEAKLAKLRDKRKKLERDLYEDLDVWQRVLISRHPERPQFLDYVDMLFDDFLELHGDRRFRDDPSIVAGFGFFEGRSVAIIGQQKGRTTKQKLHRNFGMPHPEGYRKACRVMDLANRFRRPVLTFIDTSGAYPGIGAEERGQSEAIGDSILQMSRLKVPVIATVIGEGGSGGALALGVANRLLMLQNATYSVISPEGCASILWRDAKFAPEAAQQLKLLADHTMQLGVADAVVEEPWGGAHRDPAQAGVFLRKALSSELAALTSLGPDRLVEDRYAKYRDLGAYIAA